MKKLILGLALLVTAACTNPSMERGFKSLEDNLVGLTESMGIFVEIQTKIEDLGIQVDALSVDVMAYIEYREQLAIEQAQLQSRIDALASIITQLNELTKYIATSEQLDGLATQVTSFTSMIIDYLEQKTEDEEAHAQLQVRVDELTAQIKELNIEAEGISTSEQLSVLRSLLATLASNVDVAEGTLSSLESFGNSLLKTKILVAIIQTQLAEMLEISKNLSTSEQIATITEQMNNITSGVSQLANMADYDSDGVMNALDKCPDTKLGVAVDADGCSAEQLED